jgi:molybdate transport system substrate-binding protein
VSLASWPALADELNVAVAANFLKTLQQLAPLFEQSSGHHLAISAASSGQLYTQIKQGAPFDVFLSADSARPKLLESEGLAVPGSRFTYAIGTLVLWSPRPGVVDARGDALRSAQLHMLAIADPNSAPYGAAAQQVLIAMNLWDRLNAEHRIAIAADINQAWQFAATGNADMAFVAKSQLVGAEPSAGGGAGSQWEPPTSQYSEIQQDGLVLAHSARLPVAQSFAHWLHTDRQALAMIRAAGYRL